MYNTILIDLDNTIFDFDSDEKESFIKTMGDIGLTYNKDYLKNYQKINSALWHKLECGLISKDDLFKTRFVEFCRLYGLKLDGIAIEKIFQGHLTRSSNTVKNARETLEELKHKGKRIYSASNGLYNMQINRLTNNKLLDFFDGHFISEKVKYEKPSREFFNYCLSSLAQEDIKSIIMVGDNPVADIEGGHRAGIDTCLYKYKENKSSDIATYTIDDLSELLNIV